MQSLDCAAGSTVLIASEPLDADPRWRLLAPGELVHVAVDLSTTSTMLEREPQYRLTDADLDDSVIASQAIGVTSGR
ncbi:MAG: hypothetical protein H7123_08085 [Thermoleophilia bacterium]|nr:hypothetical protein [Thermoleophilia bacterium]